MPMDFDATLKALLEESPSDWPVLIGERRSEVEVIDADIATVSGATDKVLRVRGAPDVVVRKRQALHVPEELGPEVAQHPLAGVGRENRAGELAQLAQDSDREGEPHDDAEKDRRRARHGRGRDKQAALTR